MECESSRTCKCPRLRRSLSFRRSWRKRILGVVVGLLLGIALAEIGTRLLFPPPHGPFAHNPIIREQSNDVDLFERDEELGHRLSDGRLIGVYEKRLITAEEISQDPRRKGRLFVLNLGDSSTSGWNSDVVVENARRQEEGLPLHSPFQTYETYSDVLARSDRLYVVNAGVPGFTSLQGRKYLERLLREFQELGVGVHVVTIYFGNNDSAWNGNIGDGYLLPSETFHLQLLRVLDQASNSWRVIPRVGDAEYARHLVAMIEQCREHGIDPLLIEPIIPSYWVPGLRANGLEERIEEKNEGLRGTEALAQLKIARGLFEDGRRLVEYGDLEGAAEKFSAARERDFVVPRIKESHIETLHNVAKQDGVPLVSVGDAIPVDDREYFLDYCHPVEPANELVAAGILDEIDRLWARRR